MPYTKGDWICRRWIHEMAFPLQRNMARRWKRWLVVSEGDISNRCPCNPPMLLRCELTPHSTHQESPPPEEWKWARPHGRPLYETPFPSPLQLSGETMGTRCPNIGFFLRLEYQSHPRRQVDFSSRQGGIYWLASCLFQEWGQASPSQAQEQQYWLQKNCHEQNCAEESCPYSHYFLMVVSKRVRWFLEDGAKGALLRHPETQPIIQAGPIFLILEMKSKGWAEDNIQLVTCMGNGREKARALAWESGQGWINHYAK